MDRLSKLLVIYRYWEVEKTNIFLAIVSIFLSSFYSLDGDKLVVHYPLLFSLHCGHCRSGPVPAVANGTGGGGGGGDTLAKSNTYQADYGDLEVTKGSPAHSSPTQNRENMI